MENFSQSFFVGGMVRDNLLKRNILDIDIATSATPEQVIQLLEENKISFDNSYIQFGVVVAKQGNLAVEIATMRKEVYNSSRYPKITYISDPKIDAIRRDFTVNALYMGDNNKILDYYSGRRDIKNRVIKFIGDPKKRIEQDPLRIIRALRFCLMLNFKLEQKTKLAIKNNFSLINSLTETKIKKEILKLKNEKQKNILKKVINSPETLDKYFK